MRHESYVYFVRRERDQAIKIGFSRNLPNRAKGLRAKHGRMTLLGVVRGGYYDERELHARFDAIRLQASRWKRREFFCPMLELVQYIEENAFWPQCGDEADEIMQRENGGYGVRHYCAKLDPNTVFNMRVRYYSGRDSTTTLAKENNVNSATASAAIRGASWKHVGGPVALRRSPNYYERWFEENPDWSDLLVENA